MAIPVFLAMTAAEFTQTPSPPPSVAWMGGRFSPRDAGLTGLPPALPPGALLLVDDLLPLRDHDPGIILEQLTHCVRINRCRGVLLDFQRPGVKEAADLAGLLARALPCPVGVSHPYAAACAGPVCLPPVPPSVTPEDHLAPWQGRELWLELSREGESITVTSSGAVTAPLPRPEPRARDFCDNTLACHYRHRVRDTGVRFTLYRTREDQSALLEAARTHGVTLALGLYQEFRA